MLLRSDIGRLRRVSDIVAGTAFDILGVRFPKFSDVVDFRFQTDYIKLVRHQLACIYPMMWIEEYVLKSQNQIYLVPLIPQILEHGQDLVRRRARKEGFQAQ